MQSINFDKTEIAQVSSIENNEKRFQSILSNDLLAFSLQSYQVYQFSLLHMLASIETDTAIICNKQLNPHVHSLYPPRLSTPDV